MLKQYLFSRFSITILKNKWYNKNCIDVRFHFCITDNSDIKKGILSGNVEIFPSPFFTQILYQIKEHIFLASTRNSHVHSYNQQYFLIK